MLGVVDKGSVDCKKTCLKGSEVTEKALKWCSKYLGGGWATCPMENFTLTALPGGLTNYLYLCEMDNSVALQKGEHRRVMLRIYGEISGPREKFYELLVFSQLSCSGLGPRLLAAFPRGRFEEFIQSRTLTIYELRSNIYLPQIAARMARFHIMRMPLNKRPTYILRNSKRWLPYVEEVFRRESEYSDRDRKIIQECRELDITGEFHKLRQALDDHVASTVVFCHNDVQECNLLIRTDDTSSSSSSSQELLLIDYEYSSYGYRGYDIGNHFCEWVFQNQSEKELGFDYDFAAYPDHEQQMKFAEAYLNALTSELQDEPEHIKQYYHVTPARLIYEANAYSLMSHLLWAAWGFAQKSLSHIEFSFLDYSIARFRAYFYFKDRFFPTTAQK